MSEYPQQPVYNPHRVRGERVFGRAQGRPVCSGKNHVGTCRESRFAVVILEVGGTRPRESVEQQQDLPERFLQEVRGAPRSRDRQGATDELRQEAPQA